MSGMICISASGGGGAVGNKPVISNFRCEGEPTLDSFVIKYIAIDNDNQILRHTLILDGKRTEISTDVGCENINREFTYTVKNLKGGTKYNVQIEVTDGVETVQSDVISVTTSNVQTYGVKVMENNSNPNTSVTYIEGAVGVNPANSTSLGGWANKFPFDKIRIVGFKNGQVTKEIKKDNKAQYTDGSTVPTDVDVMVEIPKVYWKFTNISNGYELKISNTKIEGSDCYAHKVGGVEKDFIYVGAYLGYNQGGKLRSRSGVTPTTDTTLTTFRTYAHNVGSGYQQFNWFTLILLQNLYLIAYKNLNSQQALGMGVCNSSKTNTGGTNTKGFVYGSSNQGQQVCFLGIEDFYGNIFQWVDGMFCNNSYQVMVTPDNKTFNDSASGFRNVGKFVNSNLYGRISKVAHTNEGGYFGKEFNGSDTTYYCDYGYSYGGCFAWFGGSWGNDLYVGAFCLSVSYSASYSYSNLGSRLVFLG